MEELLERLKIKPKNKKLYETAFQHSSYVYENHLKADYERLEFLGDAVLDLVLADYLYNNAHESANYQYAIDLHLSDYIKVGHGEEESGGRFKKVIMADIFEALMGAIYIDQGYAKARQVILHIVVPYIKNPDVTFFEDYKSALQEAVQTDQKSVSYELVKEEGPAHNRTFTTEVKVDDVSYGVGVAGSKKESEQEAARIALSKLAK